MKKFFRLWIDEGSYEPDTLVDTYATFQEATANDQELNGYIEAITPNGIYEVARKWVGHWKITDEGKALGLQLIPGPDRTYIISIIKGSVEGEVEAQDAVEAWARFCSNVTIFPKPA